MDGHTFGPGISQSGGFTSVLAVTGTIYAGVCWGVPTYDTYAGGFISLSLGAGSGPFGFAFSFFWSDSNPAQNGYSVGLTISYPPSAGWSGAIGLSYVNYQGGYAGEWNSSAAALLTLALAPGMQIWVGELAYKWYMKIG